MIYINNNTDPQMVSIPRGVVAPSSSVTQYATEAYVDNAIAEAISGITGVSYEAGENIEISGNVISVTGMPDTSEFVTSGDVETQIETAISGLNPYSAGTNINIEDFVISVTGLPTSNTAFTNDAGYVNSGEVETQISGAISGVGGEHFVELTKAQYEALTGYAEDTTYIITDAPTVDLDNLATTGDLETKADKANVSANTNRLFPRWNTQGIITGSTGNSVYEQSLNINGTSKTMLQTTNSSFGNIYAPTSAGTAGQILQSNGSGAPVWSSFKIWFGTQTQYDAITTKDNNTIYFVTDD